MYKKGGSMTKHQRAGASNTARMKSGRVKSPSRPTVVSDSKRSAVKRAAVKKANLKGRTPKR